MTTSAGSGACRNCRGICPSKKNIRRNGRKERKEMSFCDGHSSLLVDACVRWVFNRNAARKNLIWIATTSLVATGFPRWRSGLQRKLFLALRTIMGPPAANHDLLYRSFAVQAGLAFAAIGAMLDLEITRFAIGVNVIGDR
jgi:hypothetical protein